MSVSVAEAEAMVAAAQNASRKLMIGYRSQFEQHNRRAIDLVKQQVMGPPRFVSAETGFSIKADQWRLKRALAGGGSLMDVGIYSLQSARYLLGEEPVAVSAMESTDRTDPRFREVEDRIAFQLRFPSGAIGNCSSSYSARHNSSRVYGSQGWVGLEPATSYTGHRLWRGRGSETAETPMPPPTTTR